MRRFAILLLQSVGLHAAPTDPQNLEAFRKNLIGMAERLETESHPDEILLMAGSSIQALEDYNRGAARLVQARSQEMTGMVALLTRAIAEIAEASGQSIQSLQKIERDLEQSSRVEDVRILRQRLGACLTAIREERERRGKQADATNGRLRKELEESLSRLDAATRGGAAAARLNTREEAENAIRDSYASGCHRYAAAFQLERMPFFDSRFGHDAVASILSGYAQHLAKHTQAGETLLQWGPASFVLLLRRHESVDQIRNLIQLGEAGREMQYQLEAHGRPITIHLSSSWTVIEIAAEESERALLDKLDAFLEQRVFAG